MAEAMRWNGQETTPGGDGTKEGRRMSATRHGGKWVYGDHEGLNPGWRYLDTPLVLDFDPLNNSGTPRGCYTIWVGGAERDPIDHFLDGAMTFVEQNLADWLPAAASCGSPDTLEER